MVSYCEFYFPIGILGKVWYLMVSIPDLRTLTYFSFCSNLITPPVVTLMFGIAGNGVPSGDGMFLQSSLVRVD